MTDALCHEKEDHRTLQSAMSLSLSPPSLENFLSSEAVWHLVEDY